MDDLPWYDQPLTVSCEALLLSSLFYFFSYPEVDNDLWGHLFFGREILKSGNLPLQNIYSYTAPNYGWINHEWLAEVIFYWIFNFLGSPGLILFKVALGGGVVWILDRVIKERVSSVFVRVVALVWAMAILSPGFNVRPQIFTYFLFVTLLFLFYRFERGNKKILYWIPLLMVLWVNLHGGFVAGLGALGLFLFWTVFRGLRNADAVGQPIARVLIPAMLVVPALFLNPYGSDLLKFLWTDLLLDRPITEWETIPLLDFSFLEVKLATLVVLFFSFQKTSWQQWNFILAVLAALFAFRHQRHTPLFAIAAAPFLAVGVERLYLLIRSGTREWLLAALLLAIILYQALWIGRIHSKHGLQLIVHPLEYPTQAADFVQRNNIQGNMAVPFDWGEYLIWKLYPEVRVSIDGRYTTAYPSEVIHDNWEWMRGSKEWRRLLDQYPTELAITKRRHPVTELLRKNSNWIYIYSDPIAFIFVRDSVLQETLLTKFREKQLVFPESPAIYFPG